MQRAVKGQEQLAFVGAADDFAAHPGDTQSIATMMQLAFEAIDLGLRKRASDWLMKWVGVKIVDAGDNNATEAAAARIRR